MPSISTALITGMFSIVGHQGLVGMEGMWVGVGGRSLLRVTVVDWLQKTHFFPAQPSRYFASSPCSTLPWSVGWWSASFLDSGFRTHSSSTLDKRKLEASPDISKSLCPLWLPLFLLCNCHENMARPACWGERRVAQSQAAPFVLAEALQNQLTAGWPQTAADNWCLNEPSWDSKSYPAAL